MAREASVTKLMNTPEGVDQDSVLDSLRAFHVEQVRRDHGLILLAVQWARLNPGVSAADAAGSAGVIEELIDPEEMLWEELANKGCPHMEDLAIPAFADAAGVSAYQARKLIREALMLVFLLPRVWKATSAGQLETFRARLLAQECWQLTPAAVAYVDELMSASTARHTPGGRDGVIAEARLRYMPAVVAAEEEAAKEERCFGTSTEFTGSTGVANVWGTLDLTDALDLESAVSAGADKLKHLGSHAPLGVRRSWALGDLARASQQPSLLTSVGDRKGAGVLAAGTPKAVRGGPDEGGPALSGLGTFAPGCACSAGMLPPGVAPVRAQWEGKGVPASRVMIYLHLTPDSLPGSAPGTQERATVVPGGVGEGAPESTPQGTGVPTQRSPSLSTGESMGGVVRVEGNGVPSGMALTAAAVREWLTRPTGVQGPKIIFRPVVDLADEQHVESYEVPSRLREHLALRSGGCVFPYCHRKAHRSDCDHTIPWKTNGQGGPTCTCNLAPLCRFHHRAKTHADNHKGNRYTWWRYESLGEAKYLWTGPGGTKLLRTNAGVYDVSSDHRSHGPKVPGQVLPIRTLADVLASDAADDAPPKAHDAARAQERSRVQAALAVVKKIHATIPTAPQETSERPKIPQLPLKVPPTTGKKPVARAQQLEVHRGAPPASRWEEKWESAGENPPASSTSRAGALAQRLAALPNFAPSAVEDLAADLLTEWSLYSTADERRVVRAYREFHAHTGIYLPGLQPTDQPIQILTGDQLDRVQVILPRSNKRSRAAWPRGM